MFFFYFLGRFLLEIFAKFFSQNLTKIRQKKLLKMAPLESLTSNKTCLYLSVEVKDRFGFDQSFEITYCII